MGRERSTLTHVALVIVAFGVAACGGDSAATSVEGVEEHLGGYWVDTETRGAFVFHRFEENGRVTLSDGREDHLPMEWEVVSTDPIEIHMSGPEGDQVLAKAVAEIQGEDALKIATRVDVNGPPERPELEQGERLVRVLAEEAREIEDERLSIQAETRTRGHF